MNCRRVKLSIDINMSLVALKIKKLWCFAFSKTLNAHISIKNFVAKPGFYGARLIYISQTESSSK